MTFRQGDGSAYSITDGAKIWQANPGNNYPAEVTLDVTASSSPVNDRRTLLSFPAILGSSPGQIPLGSTIVSGQLSLKTSASSSAGTTDTLNLFQVLTSWSEGTVTWSSFNSGGQSGVDYATSAVGSIHPTSVGTTYNIDITPLVSAWSAGANNYGVVIIGQGAVVGDTAYFHSDDAASLTDRPLLTVEYQEPSGGGGAVPEPGNLALIGIGAGLTSVLRKRKAK
ncbi:MAG: DNRLRE domain-containing protein [Verrucomicrobia bacterium]|nr:DNRLRE domain-containing protein [Verrucomicrobiota bacterium]